MPRRYLQGVGILSAWRELTNPGAACLIKTQLFGRGFPVVWGWLPESANRLDPALAILASEAALRL